MVVAGIFLEQRVNGNDECRNEFTLVGNDSNLVDELVDQELRFNHLGSDILTVRGFEEVLDALGEEQFAILQIASITRTEIAIGGKGLFGKVLTVVVANGNRRTLQQDFTLLADLDVDAFDGDTHRSDSIRLAQVVARNGSQRLRQAIAYHHVNADGMDEFFDMSRHGSTCRGEEMGILQAQLLTHQ